MTVNAGSPTSKRSALLVAAIFLAGCTATNAPVQSTSSSVLSTTTVIEASPQPPAPTTPSSQSVTVVEGSTFLAGPPPDTFEAQPVANLYDQLFSAKATIEAQHAADPTVTRGCFKPPFPVLIPTDLGTLKPEWIRVYGMNQLGGSLKVRFSDPTDPSRWVELWQGLGCYGVLASPPYGATDVDNPTPVEVPGLDAHKALPTIQHWAEADGASGMMLIWYSDVSASPNTSYYLTAHDVDEQAVVDLVASTEPVQ